MKRYQSYGRKFFPVLLIALQVLFLAHCGTQDAIEGISDTQSASFLSNDGTIDEQSNINANFVSSTLAECDQFAYTQLLPDDGSSADRAGTAVATSGAHAIIGIPFDDDRGASSGAAHTYRHNGNAWVKSHKLLAPDGTADDRFGYSVGLSGNVAIVGAYADDDQGSSSGSAYIFRYNGSQWIFEQKLLGTNSVAGDSFGFKVSVSGNMAIIGAYGADDKGTSSGAAYIFYYNGTYWSEISRLTAVDGSAYDYFGVSVAISGSYAIVGADLDDNVAPNTGSAYVYRYNGSIWIFDAKLTASDGIADDHFGISVAIDGTVIAVGADESDAGGPATGAAYVYRRTATTWVQEDRLLPNDGVTYESFGAAIAVHGNRVLVGAPNAQDLTLTWPRNDQGAAYMYVYNSSSRQWEQEPKILLPYGYYNDVFGTAVSISNDHFIIGAPGTAYNGTGSGLAAVYDGDCQSIPTPTPTPTPTATPIPTYNINASAGTGGTINPSGNVSVQANTSRTFNITANTGYLIRNVVTDGTLRGAISSYTFTSVTSPHTISASFSLAPTPTPTPTPTATPIPTPTPTPTSTPAPQFTVDLTAPQNGAIVSGTIPMSATATTPFGRIKWVSFVVGPRLVLNDHNAPYETTFDTKTLADGTYSARAIARTTNNEMLEDTVTITIRNNTAGVNHAPNAPTTPTGNANVTAGTQHSYTTTITDPDGDGLKPVFEFRNRDTGNGGSMPSMSYMSSGSTLSVPYFWFTPGTYEVYVYTIDIHGARSPNSGVLTITVN